MSDYSARFDALKKRHTERDRWMREVSLVRSGNADQVFKDVLPEGVWSKPIIANTIDVVAKDMAEQIGVIPTISASGDSSLDESARTNADKRTKIANFYVAASKLESEQIRGADRLVTYGFQPYRVEPNYKERRPHIHVEPCEGAYWDMDRFGVVRVYAHSYKRKAGDLAAMFPDEADRILRNGNVYAGATDGNDILEVVRWYDEDKSMMFLPGRKGLVLASTPNKLGRVPVSLALMPTFDGAVRGQFNDVLPVFAAKAQLAYLMMKAVKDSVEAPLALPNDVNRLAIGPNAVIRSNSPEKIRRVPLEIPQYAFAENNLLGEELKFGTRFPEARAGQVDGSIVTGQGVKALMAGFDSQIKMAQSILGGALGEAISIALEMDEMYFGDQQKDVSGAVNGVPYKLAYKPSRDIKGNYGVNVEFGLMAGLDPNRALVFALQARGDKLLSRNFVRRNLPVSLNANEEERAIDMEEMRDSLKAGFNSMAGAIPQMAMQGQDPSKIVANMAKAIQARKNGKPMEVAIAEAFAPEKPKKEPESELGEMPDDLAPAPPGAPGGELGPAQPVTNQAVPQGPPAMQQLLAGLGNRGQPNLAARVVRQVPA